MKKSHLVALALISTLALTSSAFARDKKQTTTTTSSSSDRLVQTQSAPSTFGDGIKVGVGFSAQDSVAVGNTLSGWIDLGGMNTLQVYLGIPATSPFNLVFGTTYRRTVLGTANAGFDLGGGVGFGTVQGARVGFGGATSEFLFKAAAVMGVHFKLPSVENLLITFGGGPEFFLHDGDTNFTLGAPSLLGLGVYYFF